MMKIDFATFRKKWSRPPKYQFPTGTRVYKGWQGKGKTLSMVYDTLKIFYEWKNCVLFSNIKLELDNEDSKRYKYFNDTNGLKQALQCENGENGVIVLIDEAHLFFMKKDGVPLGFMTAQSQQRKDRRKIIMSSQIWENLPVDMRKQVPEIVNCKNIFKRIQINTVYRGETLHWDKTESAYTADKDYTYIFKHFDRLYKRYDTYQKIVTNEEMEPIPVSQIFPQLVENKIKK